VLSFVLCVFLRVPFEAVSAHGSILLLDMAIWPYYYVEIYAGT
jgi:hypothetical protein